MMKRGLDKKNISSSRCELDLSGSRYHCRLDEISAAGARVNCLGFLRETQRGDKGVLHLQAEKGDIACRVAQIEAAKIQLRFVG